MTGSDAVRRPRGVEEPESWRARLRRDLGGWNTLLAVLPAVVTYVLAALGAQSSSVDIADGGTFGPAGPLYFVAMISFTHGLVIAALLGLARREFGFIGAGGWIVLFFLYGLPIVGLAYAFGWWTVLGGVAHFAFAARGTRTWVFVEYGCTSLFLVLFLSSFEEERLFSVGLLALAFQAVLLLLMHLSVRKLWTGKPGDSVLS